VAITEQRIAGVGVAAARHVAGGGAPTGTALGGGVGGAAVDIVSDLEVRILALRNAIDGLKRVQACPVGFRRVDVGSVVATGAPAEVVVSSVAVLANEEGVGGRRKGSAVNGLELPGGGAGGRGFVGAAAVAGQLPVDAVLVSVGDGERRA